MSAPKTASFMTGAKIKKVAAGAAVGALVGFSVVLVREIAQAKPPAREPLDPPAPNMETVSPDLANLYRTFKGAFYALCTDPRKQKRFQRCVQTSIRMAEAVMTIENQLRRGEIPEGEEWYTARIESAAFAEVAVKYLRECLDCFSGVVLKKVNLHVDKVQLFLSDSKDNIRALTMK
jgi:hypothetical protein